MPLSRFASTTHKVANHMLFFTLLFPPFDLFLRDCSIISSYRPMPILPKTSRVSHKWIDSTLFTHPLLVGIYVVSFLLLLYVML